MSHVTPSFDVVACRVDAPSGRSRNHESGKRNSESHSDARRLLRDDLMLYTRRVMAATRLDTRLFHAIVLVGAALGTGCGPMDGECSQSIADAGADVTLADAGGGPCPATAPPNPILSDASAVIVEVDAAPDVQPWPPTKC